MPKKLFAVTNLKFSGDPGDMIDAGQEVDPSKFTKEQLVELHDAGAIEVRVVEETKPEEAGVSSLDLALEDSSLPVEETKSEETKTEPAAATPTKSTPAPATTTKPEDKK